MSCDPRQTAKAHRVWAGHRQRRSPPASGRGKIQSATAHTRWVHFCWRAACSGGASPSGTRLIVPRLQWPTSGHRLQLIVHEPSQARRPTQINLIRTQVDGDTHDCQTVQIGGRLAAHTVPVSDLGISQKYALRSGQRTPGFAAIRAWLTVLRVSESGGRQGPRASASARRIAPAAEPVWPYAALGPLCSEYPGSTGRGRPRSGISYRAGDRPARRWHGTQDKGGRALQVREAERQTRSFEVAVTTRWCGVRSRLGRALCT